MSRLEKTPDKDIITLPVEAIVIPANPEAGKIYGLDKYVYEKAGKEDMLRARRLVGSLNVSCCAITEGFKLQRKVIHCVTPPYSTRDFEFLLHKSCLFQGHKS